MKISLASDHGGFELKEKIKNFLIKTNVTVEDFGTNSIESVDYPDFGILASQAVSDKRADRGILICSTGIGMSIVANKIKGIRAALCTSLQTAELSRLHNDSNMLVLGGKTIDHKLALEIIDCWLNTPFEGDRHLRRINKIHDLTRR